MEEKPNQIIAIELVRDLFETIYGNLGLLKFSVEELAPLNGINGKDSKKWRVVCSFYETLGSKAPSKYDAEVDLTENSVTFKKTSPEEKYEPQKFIKVKEEDTGKEEKVLKR